MHQTLCIPEILFNIFGHCTTPWRRGYNPDLAVLARTCRTFKEPALDVLWEELYDLSPLARCLPEACRLAEPKEKLGRYHRWSNQPCYLYSRPLKEDEWTTLRGYTRRVRFIHSSVGTFTSLDEESTRVVFSLAPFTDPLFPSLRSLYWREAFAFAPLHAAVPTLTILHLDFQNLAHLPAREFFDAFGNRCPHIKKLVVDIQSGPVAISSAISHQISRWSNLQRVHCYGIALNVHAILHLSSIPTLKWLAFTSEDGLIHDILHLGSKLVFSNLTNLQIASRPLDTVTLLLRCIQLPAIETLYVSTSAHISRRAIQAYWATVREVCPSNVVTSLRLHGFDQGNEDLPHDEARLSRLMLEDLRPCTAFAELRTLHIDFNCSVGLTDTGILELVSPRMEELLINDSWGWQTNTDGGGITLSGLVQLLRRCPYLHRVCIAIETWTFTQLPEGFDVSFPPRRPLEVNFVDSYIFPKFIPDLVSVFAALGLDPSMLKVWEISIGWKFHRERFRPLWEHVLDGLWNASREQPLSSIV